MVTGVELPKVGSLVYENSHVVVVDKPAGWLSVPSRIGAKDERFCLGRVLERRGLVRVMSSECGAYVELTEEGRFRANLGLR